MEGKHQEAGNLSFLLLSCFPKRLNRIRRSVSEKDIASLGQRSFYQFYLELPERNEIGYYMSLNFDGMVDLTRKTLMARENPISDSFN